MEEVIETTQNTKEEINFFLSYIQENVPNMINFGLRVIAVILLFLIGRVAIKWIRKGVRKILERSSVDVGVEQFIDSLLKFGLHTILIIIIATKLGVDSASVAAILASAGLAVGLALQGSLSNFAGGVLILILKPFVVGDYVIENNHGNEGTIKEISLFYTKIRRMDNSIVVIPNSMLTNNSLINVTHMDKRMLDLEVSISYESDLKKAKEIMLDLVRKEERIAREEDVKIFVKELADSGVILGLRVWVSTEDFWPVRWQFFEDVKLTFDHEGIVIPYPQVEVQMKSPAS